MSGPEAIRVARAFIILDAIDMPEYDAAMAREDHRRALEILFTAYLRDCPIFDHNVFCAYLAAAEADIKLGALSGTGTVRESRRPRCPTSNQRRVEP